MLLVIETATAALSVALLDGDEVIAEHHEIVGRGHAERLLPVVKHLLGARRPLGIAVDCGPGSFTGVRVGLAAAQGLRIAWGVPTHAFSSTALVAAGVIQAGIANGTDTCAVALTGGHGEIFVEMFGIAPLRSLGPLRSLPPHEAAEAIAHPRIYGGGAAAVVTARGWGDAVDAFPVARDARLLPPGLATLPLVPIYGRAPDAKLPLTKSPMVKAAA